LVGGIDDLHADAFAKHFEYWSEKVRRSILLDSKADLLVYGNGERNLPNTPHRWPRGTSIGKRQRPLTTCVVSSLMPSRVRGVDRNPRLTHLDVPGPLNRLLIRYAMEQRIGRGSAGAANRTKGQPCASRSWRRRRVARRPPERPVADGIPGWRRFRPPSTTAADATNVEPHASRDSRRERAPCAGRGNNGTRRRFEKSRPFVRRLKNADASSSAIACTVVRASRRPPSVIRGMRQNYSPRVQPRKRSRPVQRHGESGGGAETHRQIPLTHVRWTGYTRSHTRGTRTNRSYGDEKLPGYKCFDSQFAIQRGCFGGLQLPHLCSITDTRARSCEPTPESSVIRESRDSGKKSRLQRLCDL